MKRKQALKRVYSHPTVIKDIKKQILNFIIYLICYLFCTDYKHQQGALH